MTEKSIKLSNVFPIEGYKWVKNVVQRQRGGGKPALLISEKDFHVTELCPDIITVPINVEVVWALLTPKKRLNRTRINHIVVASVYYSSTQTRKNDFLDHISETYHKLCSIYGTDLKFIFSGDFNRLNIKPILNLSRDLAQIVKVPTRANPDAILDLIVTNIPALYQSPETLSPLDVDEGQSGKHSDHLTVLTRPLTNDASSTKRYKIIKYRPFPDSAIRAMGQWIQSQTWKEIYSINCPQEKVNLFENMLMEKVNYFFPEKQIRVNEFDQPWVDSKLLTLDRKRKREYLKNKKSQKWNNLNTQFLERTKSLKESYYNNVVEDLKTTNISQWYSKVKRISSMDPTKDDNIQVDEIRDLPSSEQAEVIADKFAEISQQYQPLVTEDIEIPDMNESKPCPLFEPFQIHLKISKMKKKSSTVHGDIPWKILTEYSVELAAPIANIFNTCTLEGVWPDRWKHEYVTPVPKKFPPTSTDDLRKIAGTPNLSKLYEALLSESIISDLDPHMDPSQYGNKKGLSMNHYLINMINRILTMLDTNNKDEKYAIVAQLIDWSKAFDRQDPRLGIEAFIRNGVRPTLIPVLISFYQNRKMTVKWQNKFSSTRDLPGGCPQGCTNGILQYEVGSNDNADHVDAEMRYKFVDDLSILELLNLVVIGLSSYNFKFHVASDIGINQKFLPSENYLTQNSLNQIENWTVQNMSKLNVEKSKIMIFNFTDDFQFGTRVYLENQLLEIVTETKLLGMIITSDLKWHRNTEMLVKKAFARMIILHKLIKFKVNTEDLLIIYKLYIRSIVEQNCQVWHYSLCQEDMLYLERVQKVAAKVILQGTYTDYQQALDILNLETLYERREKLCLRFAKKATNHPKARKMFPLNPEPLHHTRFFERYHVQHTKSDRLLYSAIPQMQRALNNDSIRKTS